MGYALYGAIALVTAVYSVDLKRFRDPIEAVDTIGFGLIMLMAAVSPNRWMFHRASAFTLLGCAYVFFAIQLRHNRPQMLGIWQKALIGYFVVVGTIHHHAATRDMRANVAGAVEAAESKNPSPPPEPVA